ncbi:Diadenosine tetraphosphate (Ap4A) hydrolase [Pseudomonas sp. R1-43-08]|nr:Diadenosine tetraphosphate (Ap4A) hydrolase [Pseudomonas sp. R1-43-08]
MPGFALHFHFIPVYDWVEQAFWQDERYRILHNFGSQAQAKTLTDGAELTLFVKIVPTLPRGNAARDALRHLSAVAGRTQSVPEGIPTQSMGTIRAIR